MNLRNLFSFGPTPEKVLNQKLAARKHIRLAEQERARISYWKRERALHRRDPLLTKSRSL